MNQKIVIIGSSGMLGKELIKIFPEATGLTKKELDIGKPEDVKNVLTTLKPEIVINTAAYTNVVESELKENEKHTTEINGMAPGYIADACKLIGAKLIHISTSYVFDGTQKNGYKEDAETNPLNSYGKSKLLGEEQIKKNMQNYSIIRTSTLFGNGKNIVKTVLDLINEQKEIPAVYNRITKITYAKDLANFIKQATNLNSGIYHSTNEGNFTPLGLVSIILKLTGKKAQIKMVESNHFDEIKRPEFDVLINTKTPLLRTGEKALEEFIKSGVN